MLLRLRRDTSPDDLEALRALARELGYSSRLLDAGGRILELERARRGSPADRSRLSERACVEAVIDAGEAPELVERTPGRDDTLVAAGGARFGGGLLSILAGPCAVEDEERLLEVAREVRAAGAALLRGGAYKPRTSPYAFQGLGREGLERLRRVRDEVGIGVVTEVLDPRDVEAVAAVADMVQIGARSMTNAALLTEVGRAGRPVLLKRGPAATTRELLLAAEYVLAAGNDRVVLCERGIRGFDPATRNVLDVGAVAHLKRATHLPVVVDPSHAAGRAELVLPLARAGVAVGADGLIVEVHPRRSEVRSDGVQALSFEAFRSLVGAVRALAELDGRRLHVPQPELEAAR